MALTIVDIEARIEKKEFIKMGKKTTVCLLTLTNGFEVLGTSACVDPAAYDPEIGQRIAYENAVDKVWELEGYLLQNVRADKLNEN